ncbi:hypothetical protein [Sulfolobus islandicus rod-shaped phage 6]|uniref:Uncharacterized protein n=1 Tax=Sulfolobus islandicus rod-shaped phage 6 TaxID=1983549 RepID=A0A1X9SKM7_9VIRU|nr:hypothetical protein CCL44_gp49 [Sulfolobus islandicus rod-shaped phage 6]ARQ96778.1 hypothetical protein [Sulfolobus islandicus rod-shaped phage 6]
MNYKLPIQLKDGKYPYFEDKQLDLTGIGSRERGRIIYISGRFVKNYENGSFIEFESVNSISLKLQNAKITVTEKGTLVIKYEPNSVLYVIEIPSGFRGDVSVKVLSGECQQTNVLMSPAGSLGYVKHIWCNNNVEIEYKISGRTRTVGFGMLPHYFGENLSGKIVIKDGKVDIIFDEELDQLLS